MSTFGHLSLCLLLPISCTLLQAAAPETTGNAADIPTGDAATADTASGNPVAAGDAVTATAQRLLDRRGGLGLGEDDDFRVQDVRNDPDGSRHVRFQQRYRGLRVWGGQAILHLDPEGGERPMTDALVRAIQVEVQPNLDQAEALAIANASEAPAGAYARPPSAELVIYPEAVLQRNPDSPGGENARDFAPRYLRNHLAFHIHLELQNGLPETRHDDYLVDAHTGAVLRKWSTLFTLRTPGQPANTLGKSQYSGEVQLGSLATAFGYILSDPTRRDIATRNLAGKTEGNGSLYVSPVPRWGDGQNYDPGRGPRSENGQTAAVDAHYGLQTTWDFYRNVLGRDGIDGKGRPAYNRVHYAAAYDNAFWDDDCFCMTYGDGGSFKTLTALDVVGHEVSHGLCHATADLDYEGESGGLNEANSDIFGVMVWLYGEKAHGEGSRLPARGARWTIGEDLETPDFPTPMRYLYKPSLDGFSPDAWSKDLDYLDVHNSSGPMNRAFYFLSQGASARARDDTHSKFLPQGMRGVGNDKALRIWWRTLSTYLTPRSRYQDARRGAIRSAQDLYGRTSPEAKAVDLAFQAINVCERNAALH